MCQRINIRVHNMHSSINLHQIYITHISKHIHTHIHVHIERHNAIALCVGSRCILIEIEVHLLHVGNLGAISREVLDLLLTILSMDIMRKI